MARGLRIVVFCYHSIHPKKSFASATPELFASHLEWLKNNCNIIPFSQVLELTRNGEGHKPYVAITFDDGYADNYEFAFPLLKEYNLHATFFVTAGLIEKDPVVLQRFLSLRNCSMEDIQPLTWQQVREMREAGLDIGSHTWSHFNLAKLDTNKLKIELFKSKQVLEDKLGTDVSLLAYPFGKYRRHFDERAIDIAQELGYKYGAAVAFRGVQADDNPFIIPRFFVTKDSVEVLAQKVYGYWDWLGWWQEKAPLWLARLISPEDFMV